MIEIKIKGDKEELLTDLEIAKEWIDGVITDVKTNPSSRYKENGKLIVSQINHTS